MPFICLVDKSNHQMIAGPDTFGIDLNNSFPNPIEDDRNVIFKLLSDFPPVSVNFHVAMVRNMF